MNPDPHKLPITHYFCTLQKSICEGQISWPKPESKIAFEWSESAAVAQDLANQVALSEPYQKRIRELGLLPGKFLSLGVAEYFQGNKISLLGFGPLQSVSGLPTGWTSAESCVSRASLAVFNQVGLPDCK